MSQTHIGRNNTRNKKDVSFLLREIRSESKRLTVLKNANVSKRETFPPVWRIIRCIARYHYLVIAPKHISFVGLVKAGFQGRDKAFGKFDPQKECSFGNYVVSWVTSEIRQALFNAGDMIRVPAYKDERYSNPDLFLTAAGM